MGGTESKEQMAVLEQARRDNGDNFPGSDYHPPDRKNWMLNLNPERVRINRIVWPGTHNSATYDVGDIFTRPYAACQDHSIYDQLRVGTRVLDIRVARDRVVCHSTIPGCHIDAVVRDVKKFLSETQAEIIILEIRTEFGHTDPPGFDNYLVEQLDGRDGLLIHNDELVFNKTIAEILPRRVICVWKPRNSPPPVVGGPLWPSGYLRDDWIDTDLPFEKFKNNQRVLSAQPPAVARNYFYRVENTINAKGSGFADWHVRGVTDRIRPFARLFISRCHAHGYLDRLQVLSSDFIDGDFIDACVGLTHARMGGEGSTMGGVAATARGQMEYLEQVRQNAGETFPGSDYHPPDRKNWMLNLNSDRVRINRIVWPGTHNSATYDVGNIYTRPYAACQDHSIYDQLRIGTRVLDIRVASDRVVCHGPIPGCHIDAVIHDVKKFLSETQAEVIILEIRTEFGHTDPPGFDNYLVQQLDGLLIHNDELVFNKTIAEILPGRVICVWKPRNSPPPVVGGPLWPSWYLRDDWIDTNLPLDKFNHNMAVLGPHVQPPASARNYFYRVENTLNAKGSGFLDWHVRGVTDQIRPFARFFIGRCHYHGCLDRLQILSSDFIDGDFIDACVGLTHARIHDQA